MTIEKDKKSIIKKEIDLLELTLKLWEEKKFIFKTIIIFFLIGIIIAFVTKKEYKSSCSFILNDYFGGNKVGGLLAQFGGLAGINLNGAESEGIVSPLIFNNIVKNKLFLSELLDSSIHISKPDTFVTYYDYLQNIDKPSVFAYITRYTILLPFELKNLLTKPDTSIHSNEKSNILYITYDDDKIFRKISKKIDVSFDEETGLIGISAKASDPLASAEIVIQIYNKLTTFLINYKIEKASTDYEFIYQRCKEAEQRYEETQEKLANFKDKNKNVTTASFETEQERLQNQYQLAFNVYNGLSQQLEQAKIKVQESLPVFKIVENAYVPIQREKPKRIFILIGFIFLGFFTGIVLVITKPIIDELRNANSKSLEI